MTEVAAAQPEHAWFPTARSAEEITTPSPANRMVATPYTKLMTAIMDVDMAAAVLVATEARADALGVPADRRVYLRGAGAADEPATMAARPEPWRSPAMEAAMRGRPRAGLDRRGRPPRPLLLLRQLAVVRPRRPRHRADDRALTVTGGLPYHGGPGSNYTTHALAAMTEALRADPGSLGLVSGVGMHMTSHSAALLSTRPGSVAPDPGPATADHRASHTVPVATGADGPARWSAYSTVYSREGPEWTALICDLPDGSRSYARLEEPAAPTTTTWSRSANGDPWPAGSAAARPPARR